MSPQLSITSSSEWVRDRLTDSVTQPVSASGKPKMTLQAKQLNYSYETRQHQWSMPWPLATMLHVSVNVQLHPAILIHALHRIQQLGVRRSRRAGERLECHGHAWHACARHLTCSAPDLTVAVPNDAGSGMRQLSLQLLLLLSNELPGLRRDPWPNWFDEREVSVPLVVPVGHGCWATPTKSCTAK